ncbi:trypsin-like [Alligator sinensis]|uniref:Trypsin-like n=1 Tax=Alligator sinensis TaxID=38654 RepID=A0A1U7RB86_ALLSI|nr:trypsin-like [Alligator sinensis]
MKLLGFAVLLVLAAAASKTPRMLRGFQCPDDAHRWDVALYEGFKFKCTGVLVHKNWILTLAHCNPKGQLYARLGQRNLLQPDKMGQLRLLKRRFPYPKYNSATRDNDIMLVKLSMAANESKYVRTVCLPDYPTQCAEPEEHCILSGWGTRFLKNGPPPDVLMCGNVTVVSYATCQASRPKGLTPNMICATVTTGGTDACQADFGSPLVCSGVLQGLASWGFEECSYSDPPNVFIKVCKYINWIREVIASN